MDLQGVFTALITPFDGEGLDLPALRRLVAGQVEAGVHGLVAAGTTGESPTLSEAEFEAVVRACVEVAAGRVPVLAGTGGYDTPRTVARTRVAAGAGADAALVVTPYYNRPQQAGLFAHFERVAADGGLPVVLYNVPGRTGVNLLPETAVRLASVPGVVGIKEASGTTTQVRDIVAGAGAGFAVLSGDDGIFLPSLAVGACGVVSVASNLAPRRMVALWDAWRSGRAADAAAIDRSLAPLYSALFVEASPAPAKAAAAMLGLCSDAVRLPLVAASERTRELLRIALGVAGLP